MERIDFCFEVALAAVKGAGELINSRFCQPKQIVPRPDPKDLVTQTDLDVENVLVKMLSTAFTHHKFIAEEKTNGNKTPIELTNAPTWIIDPIDGTKNFTRNFPHSCISVALVVNKVVEVGIVYNPILNQLFAAQRGHGATLNGRVIHTSMQTDISKALCSAEVHPIDANRLETTLENVKRITETVHGVRALGSSTLNLAMVASGGADVSFDFDIPIWEYAAVVLLIREAGGVVIDPTGGCFDITSKQILCTANQSLADEMIKILKHY